MIWYVEVFHSQLGWFEIYVELTWCPGVWVLGEWVSQWLNQLPLRDQIVLFDINVLPYVLYLDTYLYNEIIVQVYMATSSVGVYGNIIMLLSLVCVLCLHCQI